MVKQMKNASDRRRAVLTERSLERCRMHDEFRAAEWAIHHHTTGDEMHALKAELNEKRLRWSEWEEAFIQGVHEAFHADVRRILETLW